MNPNDTIIIDTDKKKVMRTIILMQCAGVPALSFFTNGFMLTYFSILGFTSATTLFLLTLQNLIYLPILLPAAIMSDRFGKKNIGKTGLISTVIGYLLLTIAGSMPAIAIKHTITAGIIFFGLGIATFTSSWFALLSPIIPENIRGRFFSKLRISWQSVCIFITLTMSILIKKYSSVIMFQAFLILATALLIIRVILYLKIPEIDQLKTEPKSTLQSLRKVISTPNFMPFCAYVFLISLCTGASPWIFSLLEKDILLFDNDQIILMGTLLLIGAVAGFFIGGKMVDRVGARYVFLACHLSFGITLCVFPMREWLPFSLITTMAVGTILFGLIQGASSIAITSELLGLIPKENKSLFTTFAIMLQTGGLAASGLVISKILDLNILSNSWQLLGQTMSEYDAILLGCSLAITLLTVTLGLVPSIIGNARWIPLAT